MAQVTLSHHEGDDRCPKKRKHIAHKLLVELLASQFAFPVRWIETQDVLFSRKNPPLRFVEIGPAKVLARMAKQTADLRYAGKDLAKPIQRRFLSSNADEKDIYYEYESAEEVHDASGSPTAPASSSAPLALAVTEQPQSPILTSSVQRPTVRIPDVPISAQEVIRSLVGRKLNTRSDELSVERSIKDLAAGKSTLQNELIGILESEFSSLPSMPEDLSISQLGEGIEQNFPKDLGKESSRLLSRFFSAKLPAGFAQSEVRSYLEETWGVGVGRQTSILLLGLTPEPASRFQSVESAKQFFDSSALRYASVTGAEISKAAISSHQQQGATARVDSRQIEALREEQNEHLFKHFKVLAEHLGIDPLDNAKTQEIEAREQDTEPELEQWSSEFEDDFRVGIKPAFDARKTRYFNSSWNNVRQDVISLFHEMQDPELTIDGFTPDRRILLIANRCDDFVCKLVDYFIHLTANTQLPMTHDLWKFAKKLSAALDAAKNENPVAKFTRETMAPTSTVDQAGDIQYKEIPRQLDGSFSYPRFLRRDFSAVENGRHQPFINIQSRYGNVWQFNPAKTEILLDVLDKGGSSGISYAGKNILLTGAGPKSIAAKVIRGLLMGRAHVIVTSSRPQSETKAFFQKLYGEYGARGSELTVLPFNQGSKRDCTALIDHIYGQAGMNRNLDAIIPFAAISERAEIDGIDGRSELAHRLMLTNVLRLLGEIVRNKHARNISTRPTQVLLPLSPNHGGFGGDGLYAESKLGLESLFGRFYSETWSDYLHICGAVIGWTRGTELMSANDVLAQAIESQGVLTFSQSEMAFNLLALMTEPIAQMCENEPIMVNLNGGLDTLPDLKNLLLKTKADLNRTSSTRKAIAVEDATEQKSFTDVGDMSSPRKHTNQRTKRSTIKVGYPSLPNFEVDIAPLQYLEGMVDLSSVPVIVGFSELGPWGSARTRWEMESQGTFSQEGYIEMAWIMAIIEYFSGQRNGKHYAGWLDAKTGAQVQDSEVGQLYGRQILEHSGIRVVDPNLFGGYDPSKKEYLHEVAIEEDLPEFGASRAAAEAFKLHHGDKVSIRKVEGSDDFKVQLKRGTSLMISKAMPFGGSVAGQIPTGWNAMKYGLPEDIVRQADPVTAYALCCAAEALYSAGISDASELLRHIHMSEIGNFVGSMMGGTTKTRNMYKDRYLDKDVQGDVMQETYLNTPAAWINMLLLGAAGPIKTPTGACATGIESIDNACESLVSGKTKLCFVGGTDDFQEEESYAFRTMNATVDANKEFAQGRLPAEMSRPTSDTRAGFV